MSRTTSFGPSVSIRPSNLARAVNVNTPSNYTQRLFSVTEQPHNTVSLGRTVNVNTPKPSPIKRAVNVNTPAPAATPKTSTPRPPFTSYRGGNISPVTGCPAGQISIAGTCVAIPTYSTPASNSPAAAMQAIRDKICADRPNDPICKLTNQTPAASPAAAMQAIRDKICADRPNDPICKLTNQTPAEMIAKVRSKVKNMVKPVTSSIPTPPVTKPYPAASSVQDIRDKNCAENPEACKPYPINERGLPIAAKKLQSKYCEDHPDSELCKIGDRPVKTLPVTKPTPVAKPIADRIQEIRDKICNDSPELCEFVKQTPTPTSFANREEILKRTAEARKYCVEHPDTPVCKIILNQPASPASEQPNNEPGTPANTNPPANVPDSSASG